MLISFFCFLQQQCSLVDVCSNDGKKGMEINMKCKFSLCGDVLLTR